MAFLSNHQSLLFIAISFFFIIVSLKPLRNIRSHGFYRFFAFEGILALVCLNLPFWFSDPYSPLHIISWLMLICSVFLVTHGLYSLITRGGSGRQDAQSANFKFENTVHLVDTGIYRHIRHPMYTSLLLLAWGAFLKHISPAGCGLLLLITGALVIAAKIEEQENHDYFGPAYKEYMKRSRMFIPGVL